MLELLLSVFAILAGCALLYVGGDMLVSASTFIANRVGNDCGFDADENSVNVIWPEGERRFAETGKSELARDLVDLIARHFYAARGTDTQPRLTVISSSD